MRLPEEPDTPAQINIVPMIDVIFAILTFFIMATLFLTRSEGLPVNLPEAASAQRQEQTRITVTIDNAGAIAVNQETVQLENLETEVRSLIEAESQALVIINADQGVDHGRVVAVMDRLRNVEGANLAIATQQPQ